MIKRDVIIVGAGVAGSVCAAYLAKAGADVLLLEKEMFPRDKACGDLLREGIVTHLSRLGIFDDVDERGTLIRRLHLISPNGSECVVPYEAYAMPRYQLDDLLVNTAVKRGTEFRDNCRVMNLLQEDDQVTGVHVRERGMEYDIEARLVILADGSDFLAPEYSTGSAGEFVSCGRYVGERAYFTGIKLEEVMTKGQYNAYGVFGFHQDLVNGYYWIMPSGASGVSEGYCNVGIIRDAEVAPEVSAQDIFTDLIDNQPRVRSLFFDAKQVSPWKSDTIKDVTSPSIRCGNGYLVIGNAGSIMMPLLKDGTSAAADSGQAAAAAVKEAMNVNDFSRDFFQENYMSRLVPDQDRLRYERLTVESLYDPTLMDTMIARIVNNPDHTKKVLREVFG